MHLIPQQKYSKKKPENAIQTSKTFLVARDAITPSLNVDKRQSI
jgi:hypothetical protein